MAEKMIHTDGDFYVLDTGKEYQIYRNQGTAAVRRASIGKSLPDAWARVKAEIERRKVSDPGYRFI